VPTPAPQPSGILPKWKSLPVLTRIAVLLQVVFLVVAIGAFTIEPVAVAQAVGSPTIVVLAASSWVCLGSFATYVSNTLQLPVLRTLLVLALLFSYFNDNHLVRPVSGPRATQPTAAPSLVADFTAWAQPSPQAPWLFVITEGGGIRAAYWTADVLTRLQDRNPEFGAHLYGISSVSGGSLGAAVYVSLLARRLPQGHYQPGATRVLSIDSLAPVLAMGLYPDMFQHFWPWPIEGFDRGRGLEQSWSVAFGSSFPGANAFSSPFDDLWTHASSSHPVPRLFLNTTSVETGQRGVVSYPKMGDDLTAAMDVGDTLGSFSLAQSVHLSARFTYVSPAGLMRQGTRPFGHLVDGGYFDNSGGSTALDVLGAIASTNRGPSPVVLVIKFDDAAPAASGTASDGPPSARWASDLLAPVDAVLNARVARGSQAVAALTKAYRTIPFVLKTPEGGTLPLGWMLSAKSRGEIDDVLKSDDILCRLAQVDDVLSSGPSAAERPCPGSGSAVSSQP